jgi:hypothetical protein
MVGRAEGKEDSEGKGPDLAGTKGEGVGMKG